MFTNILQHLQKMRLQQWSSLYTKESSNTKIKSISFNGDGMQLMIFGYVEIVGPEEHPTYKLWLLNKCI